MHMHVGASISVWVHVELDIEYMYVCMSVYCSIKKMAKQVKVAISF